MAFSTYHSLPTGCRTYGDASHPIFSTAAVHVARSAECESWLLDCYSAVRCFVPSPYGLVKYQELSAACWHMLHHQSLNSFFFSGRNHRGIWFATSHWRTPCRSLTYNCEHALPIDKHFLLSYCLAFCCVARRWHRHCVMSVRCWSPGVGGSRTPWSQQVLFVRGSEARQLLKIPSLALL